MNAPKLNSTIVSCILPCQMCKHLNELKGCFFSKEDIFPDEKSFTYCLNYAGVFLQQETPIKERWEEEPESESWQEDPGKETARGHLSWES